MCTKQGKKIRESVVFKQHYPTPNAGWSSIRNVQQNPISQRLWGLLPLTSWDFYPHCLMLIRTLSDTYGGFWIASLSLTRTELSDITHSCNCSSERTGNLIEQTECLYGIYFLLTEQNLLDLGSISRMPQLVEQQAQVVRQLNEVAENIMARFCGMDESLCPALPHVGCSLQSEQLCHQSAPKVFLP